MGIKASDDELQFLEDMFKILDDNKDTLIYLIENAREIIDSLIFIKNYAKGLKNGK